MTWQLSSIGTAIQQWLVMPLIAAGKTAIMAASEAEESANKFTEVFGYVAREAEEMAKVLDNSFGMSRVEARRLMGATGDLLNSFGFTKKASLDLSVQVQQLAADMVSFSNFEGGFERASTAITRALLGEKEMLKLLGKAILDKDVLERVAINTAKGLAFETERQAKAFATLQLIQEQSLNAVGDYQRTMWQFANQLRELQSNIQDVAAAFGQDLLPAATSVVTALNSALSWVKDLNPVMRGLVEAAGVVAVAVGGLIASLLALGGVVVYTAGLSLVLKASLMQLSGVIISAASSVATAVASMSAALTASMAAALATPVGLAAAILAAGAAASVASYKFSLWMTGYTNAMANAVRLTQQLHDLQAKRSDDVLSIATGLGDAETRKKYVEEQIAQAEKDVAGRTMSVQMSQQQADETDTTFKRATGNKLRLIDQQQLTEDLQLLEAAKQHVQRLQSAMGEVQRELDVDGSRFEIDSQVAELEAELRKRAELIGKPQVESQIFDIRGITDDQAQLLRDLDRELTARQELEDAKQRATDSVKDWQLAADTIGMTTRELELYKAELAGVPVNILQDMRKAMEVANQADTDKKHGDIASDWAKQAETIGMTSREVQIYQAAMDGASESVLQAMIANNALLSALEAGDTLNKAAKDWEEQAKWIGRSSREIEILKAAANGASEAQLRMALAADAHLKQAELSKKVQDLTKDLQSQAETFGMSSAQASIYKLAMEGATEAQLQQANALAQVLKKQEEHKKLQDKAKELTEKHLSPLEKFRKEQAEVKRMYDEHMISTETMRAEMEELYKQFQKDYTAKLNFEGAEGIEAGSAQDAAALRAYFAQREAEKQLNDLIGKPMQGALAAGGGPGFLSIPANRKNASPSGPDTVAVNAAGAGLNSQEAAFRTNVLEALRAIATNTAPKPGQSVLNLVTAGLGSNA